MALSVRIVTSFPRGDRTPDSILWEGVIEVQNPDKIVPEGQPGAGYPERVLKGQVKLVNGGNGPFVGTPSRKTNDGRYFNYYDLGPSLQRLILPAIQQAYEDSIDAAGSSPAPAATSGDLVSEAAAAFDDLAF